MQYVVEVYTYTIISHSPWYATEAVKGPVAMLDPAIQRASPQSNDLAPENPGGCTTAFCHPTPTLGDATHNEHGVYAIHSTLSLLLARIHHPSLGIRIEELADYRLYHLLKVTPIPEDRRRHHQPPTCHNDEPRRANHHSPPLPLLRVLLHRAPMSAYMPNRSPFTSFYITNFECTFTPSSSSSAIISKTASTPVTHHPSRSNPALPDPGSASPPVRSRSYTHLRSTSCNATTTHPSNFPPTYSSNEHILPAATRELVEAVGR